MQKATSAGVALSALLLWSSAARAQERLHFEELGDERLWDTTIQIPNHDADDLRYKFLGGIAASSWPLSGPSPTTLVSPFLGFGLGASSAPDKFLQLYSEVLAPFDASVPNELGRRTRWTDFEGDHRARASWGFGEVSTAHETGVDVEGEARLSHAGPVSTSYLRRDLPLAPFWDGEATARLWPRIGEEHDSALVAPISVTARRVAYGDDAQRGFTSERASAGVGLRPYDRGSSHGWFELVGLSWEKTAFDGAERGSGGGGPGVNGAATTGFSGVERVDVRGLHVDGLYFAPESDMTFNLNAHLGGAWLWDPRTGQQVSAFTASFLYGMRMYTDSDKRDSFEMDFGFARRAGFLADASAITRGWRLEGLLDASFANERMGASIRYATEQLSAVYPGARDDVDLGWKTAVATELFFAPIAGMKLGVFHVATDRCPVLARANDGDFCHQLGVFLRLEQSSAPPRETPPPPETKPPEPKPEPKPESGPLEPEEEAAPPSD